MIQDAWMSFWGPEFGAAIAFLGVTAVCLVAGFAGIEFMMRFSASSR